MGKKPVVAIVGLIWAGMVLVGCENCKNCRNKFNAPPTYPAKAAAPTVSDGAASSNAVTPVGDGLKAVATPKAPDEPTGTKGFGGEATGTPVSTATPTSPTTQTNLRPGEDLRPTGGLPGQGSDYRSDQPPPSRLGSTDGERFRMPPVPVSPRSVTPVSASGETELPPILNTPQALPPRPYKATPPTSPSMGGNELPGVN